MSKSKAQGTRWESEFVRRCQGAGLLSARLPEGGMKDYGDIWVNAPPHVNPYPLISVVAWKRLTGSTAHRTPDGDRDVVVLSTDDFLHILFHATSSPDFEDAVIVECKATQTLNVTRTLAKARRKAYQIE